jgi:rSAM/selenodomain-associated transferase 2
LISIIVPTLNEARNLPLLLADLRQGGEAAEIIVADGGSTDETATIARDGGVDVIRADRGRGHQSVAGAAVARGETLLFLHADSRFPAGGLARIVEHLAERPEAVGGNFRLAFDGGTDFDAWLERFYAWIRSQGVYYGDSGIFVRRAVYERLGGIRPIALMEDYDFVRRLERAGPTICIDDPALVTSSRRFTGRSPVAIFTG